MILICTLFVGVIVNFFVAFQHINQFLCSFLFERNSHEMIMGLLFFKSSIRFSIGRTNEIR